MNSRFEVFLGIDPGWRGAIAGLQADGAVKILEDCPSTPAEIGRFVCDFKAIALIEKVHPFYKSSAKSAFTFGENFGAWQAMLSHLQIPFEFITPRQWQKSIFDSAKKLENTKRQSYDMASRLFPDQELKTSRGKILDGRCDALLIAEVLRRRCLMIK